MDRGLGSDFDLLRGLIREPFSEESLGICWPPENPGLGPKICSPNLDVKFFFSSMDCGFGHSEPLSEETGLFATSTFDVAKVIIPARHHQLMSQLVITSAKT